MDTSDPKGDTPIPSRMTLSPEDVRALNTASEMIHRGMRATTDLDRCAERFRSTIGELNATLKPLAAAGSIRGPVSESIVTVDDGLLLRSPGGYDARPYHHAAPHVRVAFGTSNPNYGRARNDAERLAHFAHSTTAPALSGVNGLGTALTDLAARLRYAIKLAYGVPLRNDRTVATRNAAVRDAETALAGILAFAASLRETGALPPVPDAPVSTLTTITPEPLQ